MKPSNFCRKGLLQYEAGMMMNVYYYYFLKITGFVMALAYMQWVQQTVENNLFYLCMYLKQYAVSILMFIYRLIDVVHNLF